MKNSFLLPSGLCLRMLLLVAMCAVVCGSARADGIVNITSNVTVNQTTPAPGSTVGANFLITLGLTPGLAFDEQQNVVLSSSLANDTGTIAAGTVVSSYFVVFNVPFSEGTDQSTTITFSKPVLGIVFMDGSSAWAASDFLGLSTLNYQDNATVCPSCGYEAGETATFAGDQAFLNSGFSVPGDFARIITAGNTTVPEPGSLTLLCLGLAVPLLRKRKSCFLWLRGRLAPPGGYN
jgi:PEP-CTERM motif